MSVRILVVEDHQLVREGICALLEKTSDFEIAGEADSGEKAIEMAQAINPDIILMDVTLPKVNGIEATRQILQRNSHPKIIALSIYSDKRFVKGMLYAGAAGYVLKEGTFKELTQAIRVVLQGGTYLSLAITGVVVQDYRAFLNNEGSASISKLTTRENEVLKHLVEGKNAKEIAASLKLSTKTIESHRRQIMDKLGLQSIVDLTKYAIREGLTTL